MNKKLQLIAIVTLALILAVSKPANAQNAPKKDSAVAKPKVYTLQEGQAVIVWNLLDLLKAVLPKSDAVTAGQASNGLMALDSIQRVLYKQSVDTTSKPKK
jgi:hypothetical protein